MFYNPVHKIWCFVKTYSRGFLEKISWRISRGVVANEEDCNVVESKFYLHLSNYIHFRIYILWKGMNSLIFASYGLNSTNTVLLQGWLWY